MTNRQGETRVAAATIIGTAIEWYDFFLYAAAAGLVFNKVFFASSEPAIATLLSFSRWACRSCFGRSAPFWPGISVTG